MKKLAILFAMTFAVALWFGSTVSAELPPEPGPEITKEITGSNTDLVIEVKQLTTTEYEFEITYNGNGDATDVIIKDTVPAEWNVTHINGELIEEEDRFNDKNDPNIFSVGGGTDNVTVFRSGRDKRSDGKKRKTSSTQICWIPFTPDVEETLTVTVETRQSPSGKPKFAPTSCGLLLLNDGAIAFEYDPIEEEIVLEFDNPIIVAGPTDPLKLVAVKDLDGGGVNPDGTGDEDGDTLTDADEVLIHGTSPCDADSDGDGCDDNLDTDPVNPGPDVDGDGAIAGCDADDNDDTVQ